MSHWLIWGMMSVILLIATITDLNRRLVPNRLIFWGFIGLLLVHLMLHPGLLPDYLLSFLGFFMGLWLLSIVSKGAIGGGDVKLFALIGFGVGAKAAWWIFIFSHVLGAIAVLLLWQFKRAKKGDSLPFAPYMLAGLLLAWISMPK